MKPAVRLGGIVLAGGRSSRMGRPKAWLPVGGRTMLQTVLDAVADGICLAGGLPDAAMVVVAAPDQDLPPLPAGVDRAEDAVEGEGPLRGMQAGFKRIADRVEVLYLSSCDAPLIRPAFVARMISMLGDHDIAVPFVEGRHHPLAAVYRTTVAAVIGGLLDAGRRRPFDLFDRARTRIVTAEELRPADPELDSLRNFNSPSEYEELLARLAGGGPASGGAAGGDGGGPAGDEGGGPRGGPR